MARNTHRTFSPDLFSHQIIWFVLGVSLHNSETSGNHALENLETGAWWQKQYFPPVKAGYFQTQTWQKDTLAHFSPHYNNSFGQVFDFSERNRLLATCCQKVIWEYSFINHVLTAMPVTLIRWNSAVRQLQSFKWQAACFFQKFQILDKAVVMKRKMNQCVFLADLRLQISNIHSWKILVLPSGPSSQVYKDMFPCSFRAV